MRLVLQRTKPGETAPRIAWERLKCHCWHPIKQQSEMQNLNTASRQAPLGEGREMEDSAGLEGGQSPRERLQPAQPHRYPPLRLGYLEDH